MTGMCALHPEREAAFTCARCGDYGCAECARRPVPTAAPICATCWQRREERVAKLAKDDGSLVCAFALGLGVLALVPLIWPAQLGALILGAVGLRRAPAGTKHRTFALIGMALGVLGFLGTLATFGVLIAGP